MHTWEEHGEASPRRRRVMVLTISNHNILPRLSRGILRQVQSQGTWQLFNSAWDGRGFPTWQLSQGFDGMITTAFMSEEISPFLNAGLPVVNVVAPSDRISCTEVLPDDAAIVALALQHLRERRVASLVVAGSWDYPFARERAELFAALVRSQGLSCTRLNVPEELGPEDHRDLLHWVAGRTDVTGVFAASDREGRTLVNAALEAGVSVPGRLLVVGVDNDPRFCEEQLPSLSSIDPDYDRLGVEVVKALDRLMDGERLPARILVPPNGLLARRSTDTVAVEDGVVAQALASIRERFAQKLKIADLALAAGLSRRVLERRFQVALGHGPAEELRQVRLQHAKTLLVETRLTMAEIARACGFSSANSFAVAFKRQEGLSPAERARG